jgi:hypothetical protein
MRKERKKKTGRKSRGDKGRVRGREGEEDGR